MHKGDSERRKRIHKKEKSPSANSSKPLLCGLEGLEVVGAIIERERESVFSAHRFLKGGDVGGQTRD